MSTDFRALCRELTDELSGYPSADPYHDSDALVVRARAALAEPVPEDDVALLREALAATAAQRRAEDDARAALAADGPAVPESRETASVVGEPSDEELAQAAKAAIHDYKYPTELVYFLDSDSSEYEPFLLALRAVIAADRARFGHQPAPVAAGEVANLVAEIRHFLAGYRQIRGLDPEYVYAIHQGDAMEAHIRISRLARAADLLAHSYLLAQRPEPVPVPKGPTRDDLWELWLRLNNELPDRPAAVAEFWEHAQIDARARAADLLERQAAPVAVSDRLPGPEDCDAEGRCWWCDPIQRRWDFLVADNRKPSDYTQWLPANTLPLPAGEVE